MSVSESWLALSNFKKYKKIMGTPHITFPHISSPPVTLNVESCNYLIISKVRHLLCFLFPWIPNNYNKKPAQNM